MQICMYVGVSTVSPCKLTLSKKSLQVHTYIYLRMFVCLYVYIHMCVYVIAYKAKHFAAPIIVSVRISFVDSYLADKCHAPHANVRATHAHTHTHIHTHQTCGNHCEVEASVSYSLLQINKRQLCSCFVVFYRIKLFMTMHRANERTNERNACEESSSCNKLHILVHTQLSLTKK